MSDLQVLIENIRTAISFPETVLPDQLRIYARDYSEACVDLNRRMQQCIPHIRKGNVAEAVRLAEMTPNLPELYSLLDFPEREEWIDIVSTLGFDLPPALSADLSRELNATYLKFSPLEPLFRWHRMHALNGSPIRDRLAVLRAIAKADSENMFWSEDQEKFEKIRIAELEKEVRAAVSARNSKQIQMLYEELNAPDWAIQPPRELNNMLCASVLQSYADELQQHFAAFDYPKATSVYNAMQHVLVTNNMSLPSSMAQAVRPALAWLEQTNRQDELQMQFMQCSAAMQNALEAEAPAGDLERLYYNLNSAASQAGMDIPEELERLYQSQIHAGELRRSRAIMLKVVSVVCGSLLIGGLVAWGLFYQMHRQRINETLANLEQIELEGRYEEIQGTVDRIEKDNPEIVKIPEITSAIERLRAMKSNDDTRAEDFQRYYTQAVAALDAPIRPALDELARLEVPISQAEKLARTPQEKTQHTELKRKYDTILSGRKREIDVAFSEELTSLSNEFNSLRRNDELPPQQIVSRLDDLIRQIESLSRKDNVSPTLKETATSTVEMIGKFKQDKEVEIQQEKSFADLIPKIGDWSAYESALKNFAATHSAHHAAADAKEVSVELDGIKTLAQPLSELSRNFVSQVSDYKKLQESSTSLLELFKEIKSDSNLDETTGNELFPPGPSLEMLAKAVPASSENLRGTESLLKSLSQREVWPWTDKNERWYYLLSKPTKPGDYKYVTTFVSEERKYNLRDEDYKNAKERTGTQYQFSIAALKKIDGIQDDAAHVVGELMISMLGADGIDPILKCVLLDAFISDTSKIDPVFARNYEKVYNIISKCGVDMYLNWMDVASKNTIPQRNLALSALKRLPDMKALAEKTRRDRIEFKETLQAMKPQFQWVGFLARQDSAWTCQMRSSTYFTESGDLFVLRVKPDGALQPYKVGTLSSDGNCKIVGNESTRLQCLPVFFKR